MSKLELKAQRLAGNIQNEYLSIVVSDIDRFNSGSVIPGNDYNISFNWPNPPGTVGAYTTIRVGVGGQYREYIYGQAGVQVPLNPPVLPIQSNPIYRSAWMIEGIYIEQRLEIVKNPYDNKNNMGKYSYIIKDIDAPPGATVGVRVMIDTMVNGDDAPNLVIPNTGVLAVETQFVGNSIPEYWQGLNSVDTTKRSLGILLGEEVGLAPDRVIFAKRDNLYNNQWDYIANPNLDLSGDNAMAIYWNEYPVSSLRRGELRMVTHYGVLSDSILPFKNKVTMSESTLECIGNLTQEVEVAAEIKVFGNKYKHSEADCMEYPECGVKKLGKGDDLGFTLVFGNYGELTYKANPLEPTVEDTLDVQSPIDLKLMSLCMCEKFILFNLNTNKKVEVCDIFKGGILYRLQVKKLKEGGNPDNSDDYEASFDIPCHTIYCISMLFQVEFPPCVPCPQI